MRNKKWMTGCVLLIFVVLLTACGSSEFSEEGIDLSKLSKEGIDLSDDGWTVPDFTYTNQDGEPFGLADLEGKVWLADLIFTNCTTVCPPMTANMSQIQQKLEAAGLEIPIVSFSVDPDRDTPEVLTEYAEQFGANTETWQFLTGYTFDEIKQLSEETFKAPLLPPPEGDDQITHGVSFYLIYSDKVIKSYNGAFDTPIDAIIEDVEVLSANSQ